MTEFMTVVEDNTVSQL